MAWGVRDVRLSVGYIVHSLPEEVEASASAQNQRQAPRQTAPDEGPREVAPRPADEPPRRLDERPPATGTDLFPLRSALDPLMPTAMGATSPPPSPYPDDAPCAPLTWGAPVPPASVPPVPATRRTRVGRSQRAALEWRAWAATPVPAVERLPLPLPSPSAPADGVRDATDVNVLRPSGGWVAAGGVPDGRRGEPVPPVVGSAVDAWRAGRHPTVPSLFRAADQAGPAQAPEAAHDLDAGADGGPLHAAYLHLPAGTSSVSPPIPAPSPLPQVPERGFFPPPPSGVRPPPRSPRMPVDALEREALQRWNRAAPLLAASGARSLVGSVARPRAPCSRAGCDRTFASWSGTSSRVGCGWSAPWRSEGGGCGSDQSACIWTGER